MHRPGSLAPSIAAAWIAFTVAAGASPAQGDAAGELVRDRKGLAVAFAPATLADAVAAQLVDEASSAAQAGWALAQKRLGVRARGKARLTLALDRAAFERAVVAAGAVSPPGEPTEWTAEGGVAGAVLLTPAIELAMLEHTGVPAPTRQALVRTAVRMLVAQQLSAVAVDGDWLVDLLAFDIAELVANPERTAGVDVEYDSRRHNLAIYRYGRRLSLDAMVKEQYPEAAAAQWSARECSLCAVAEFLDGSADGWNKRAVQALKRRAKGADAVEHRRAFLVDLFGGDWLAIDSGFDQCLSAMAAQWTQSSPMLDVGKKPWVLAGTATYGANVMRVDPVPTGDYAIALRCTLWSPTERLRVLLDWDGSDMVAAEVGGEGCAITRFAAGAGTWETLAEAPQRAPVGREVRLEVRVASGSVRVLVDGDAVLSWNHGARTMRGMWGLATNGTVLLRSARIDGVDGR